MKRLLPLLLALLMLTACAGSGVRKAASEGTAACSAATMAGWPEPFTGRLLMTTSPAAVTATLTSTVLVLLAWASAVGRLISSPAKRE